MRGWLVGVNLFLAGILVTVLIVLPSTESNLTAAKVPTAGSVAPVAAVEPPRPAEPEPGAAVDRRTDFIWNSALDTLITVKGEMRDPGSAQFRNLWAVTFGDTTVGLPMVAVCGEVNGGNAFGGTTGFVPFVASGSVISMPDTPGFSATYERTCAPDRRRMQVTF